ncbi:MAG: NifU family protein [Candidatus Thermoplasmatota archaeon]|nr:NifU family protein [Candidatus Thermoplasmatota archaeon]MDI6855720.1 NifU family protein [Candidatus Thermoplasmatota archaeon]
MIEKVRACLERIKINIQAHGGDVELINVDESSGTVTVRLTGACATCPMAKLTLQKGVEEELKKEVPAVKKVIAVESVDWQI